MNVESENMGEIHFLSAFSKTNSSTFGKETGSLTLSLLCLHVCPPCPLSLSKMLVMNIMSKLKVCNRAGPLKALSLVHF